MIATARPNPRDDHFATAQRLAAQFPGEVSLVYVADDALAHLGARRGDYVAFNASGDPVFLAFAPEPAAAPPAHPAREA